MEDATDPGNEGLTVDRATAAYVKATAPKEAPKSQSEGTDEEQGTTDEELQATDEDAGEEDDGQTEDDGQADDGEDDAEPESDQGRFVASNGKVKLPDGTVSTVSELLQGHLRDRDYRQKTMELSEHRKAFETQSQTVKQRETQLQQQAEYVTGLLKAIIPAAPDPQMADPNSPNYDPLRYQAAEVAHRQWAAHIDYLHRQKQQAEQASQAETKAQRDKRANEEWAAATEKLTFLKDQKRLDAFVADVKKYGTQYGYSDKEIAEAGMDHRQLVILDKAMRWDKLQASKAGVQKKVEGRPPVQRGGKRLSPAENRSRSASDAIDRLKQSGSEADAVAAYLATRKTG